MGKGRHQSDLEAALDAFEAAPFDDARWFEAIDRTAAATGSRMGQLIGLMRDGALPMHILTDDLPMTLGDWLDLGGATPVANPMIRTGLVASPMTTIIEAEVRVDGSRAEGELWGGFFDPCDVPHLGCLVLDMEADRHLAMSVMRRRREGPLEGDQRRLFEQAGRAAANAVKLARVVGRNGAEVLMHGLEAVEATAVAFNRSGQMLGMTAAAAGLVKARWFDAGPPGFTLNGPAAHKAFTERLAAAVRRKETGELSVARGAEVLKVSVLPLPSTAGLWFGAAALAVFSVGASLDRLTPAELEVFRHLQAGLRTGEIAELRGVSHETTRSQAKAIYQKLQVRDQVDLMRRRWA